MGKGTLGEMSERRKYDFVFSLGAACSCSQALRLAGLQFASYPFDWLYGGGLANRARLLVTDFAGWLDEARLVKHNIDWKLEHEPYRNEDTGIVFKHDFDWNTPLSSSLPGVKAKYARRIKRLYERIGGAKRVLAVWINTPTSKRIGAEEARKAHEMMAAHWPEAGIELLVLNCERGVGFETRKDETQDGVRIIGYDYYDGRDEFIDNEKMAKFLASEYCADDYRSEQERKEWPRKRKLLKYATYNATTWLEYAINRWHYRMYRHFRKWIEKKGLSRLG